MKNRIIRYSALVLLVLLMCVIFFLSAQSSDISQEMSNDVIEKIISIFYPQYNNFDDFAMQDIVITLVFPIRKLAHFFEFFMLGISSFVFLSTFKDILKNHRFLISFLFGFFYAVSDEVHQIFVPGRACQFSDILLDSFGVFAANIVCSILFRIRRRIHSE